MKKTILVGLVVLGLVAGKELCAETYVSGTITSNTNWTQANSPYIATDTVTVANGVVLTIEPGVTVRFATETSLICYGTLNAVGTPLGTITFTSSQTTPAAGDWKGINLSGSGATGSQISYCDIRYAKQAVYLENVSNVEISYNTIRETKGDNGVSSSYNGKMGVGVYLISSNRNVIKRNVVSKTKGGIGYTPGSFATGGRGGDAFGIYLYQSGSNTVSENSILDTQAGEAGVSDYGGNGGDAFGIYLYQSGSNTVSKNGLINIQGGKGGNGGWDSYYYVHRRGGSGGSAFGMYLYQSGSITINENTISNTQGGNGGYCCVGGNVHGNGGSGMGICLSSATNSVILNNIITYSTGGAAGGGGATPGGGNGICSYSSNPTIHYNSLSNSKNGDGTKSFGVYHDGSSGTISAT
ncbi:right-handed parallel beta-helix repeat-containing protein, partial [bacterium]|nr:right-handed parallel beta-helix repeat-containing protein [bacterium]